MTADLLRRAAAKIRETAQATHQDGGWYDKPEWLADALDPHEALDEPMIGTANHIVLWSPDVAELVAAWLDAEAGAFDHIHGWLEADRAQATIGPGEDDPLPSHEELTATLADTEAVALARRILGEDL